MKVQVLVSQAGQVESGYSTIMLNQAQQLVDGSVESLYLGDVLDFVDFQQRLQVVMTLLQKVKYDGEIVISGLDALAISMSFATGTINLQQYNQVGFNGRRSCGDTDEIIGVLKNSNFDIVRHNRHNNGYHIQATRRSK